MSRNWHSRRLVWGAAVLAGVVLAGGIAGAEAAASGVIYTCVNRTGGIRIIAATAKCLTTETPLSWNIQGIQGPAGPQGAVGPQGSPGVSGEQIVLAPSPYTDPIPNTQLSASSPFKNATATCPSGKTVIGGGGQLMEASPMVTHTTVVTSVHIASSYPSSTSAWTVEAGTDLGFPWQVTAYAICANVAP
jgi:hypothetical protein